MMTRDEHLDWAKRRALEYAERGELVDALASMLSDLSKHEELEKHAGIMLGMMMAVGGQLNTADMRKFIEGFR